MKDFERTSKNTFRFANSTPRIETSFKISPLPRTVCVAPRPREPGSHVIMAEVAEKKRFEVKKVRTTRVR